MAVKDGYGEIVDLNEHMRDVTLRQIMSLEVNPDVIQNDKQLCLQSWVKLGIELVQLSQGKDTKTDDLPSAGDDQTKSK